MDQFDFNVNEFFTSNNMSYSIPSEIVETIVELKARIKELDTAEEELKKRLLEEMQQKDILQFSNENITISYIPPHKEEYFDMVRFKAIYPKIYDENLRFNPVKSSISIKVK